jgi:Uma2 family endonuclease
MATAVTLDEYLRTTYEPECDYVDGALVDRNASYFHHSRLLTKLIGYLRERARPWGVHLLPILRIRVSETRIRIADLCLYRRGEPVEQIPTRPPLLWIEVLDPLDRWPPFEKRLQDMLAMGVPPVWVFDPEEQQVFDCTPHGRRLVTEETLEAPPISIALPDLFASLG